MIYFFRVESFTGGGQNTVTGVREWYEIETTEDYLELEDAILKEIPETYGEADWYLRTLNPL